jgi:hypothetical protein
MLTALQDVGDADVDTLDDPQTTNATLTQFGADPETGNP